MEAQQQAKALTSTLEQFMASNDFKAGVISSTKAGWKGDWYSVEILEDGTWNVEWNIHIGNKYEPEGVILRLPTIEDDDVSEASTPTEVDTILSEAFDFESRELAEELRTALREALQ